MKRTTIVFLSLTFATTAWAQPEDAPADPMPAPAPVPEPAPIPEPAPNPEPAPIPEPAPENPHERRMQKDLEASESGGMHERRGRRHNGKMHRVRKHRPETLSLGLGFGWALPGSDIQVPDITSARFRLGNGLIIEPALELSKTSTKTEAGAIESSDDLTTILLSSLVRFPVMRGRKLDLVAIGGLTLGTETDDPDGPNNATTTTIFQISYGLGVEYWFNAHWNVSATTLNPLFTFAKNKQDGAGGDTSISATQFGLVFEPNVLLMAHLFFE